MRQQAQRFRPPKISGLIKRPDPWAGGRPWLGPRGAADRPVWPRRSEAESGLRLGAAQGGEAQQERAESGGWEHDRRPRPEPQAGRLSPPGAPAPSRPGRRRQGPEAPSGGSRRGHWPPGAGVGGGAAEASGYWDRPAAAAGGGARARQLAREGAGSREKDPLRLRPGPVLDLKGKPSRRSCPTPSKNICEALLTCQVVLDLGGCKVAHVGLPPRLASN